ncbi:MAG: hypothetical protein DRG78_10455 [Epsilonproteobacteria bacterium]|nr:MAG: hypothetical protein DRG78_10455 [Campylobacterota bacterium]
MDTIKNIILKKDITVDIHDSIENTINTMFKNKQGVIIVLAEGSPVGIVTERDILHIINTTINFKLEVKSILSLRHLITVNINRSIDYALHILVDNEIRRLVVVDKNNNFKGIVTQDILIKHLEDDTFKTNLLISSFIQESKDLICLEQNKTVEDAFKIMNKNNIGSIIVIDQDNNPIGILTERDTISIANNKIDLHIQIKNVMSSPIITVCETNQVKYVVDLMDEKKIRRVLVLQEDTNKPLSLLGMRDIAHSLKGNYGHLLEAKLKNMKNTLHHIGESVLEIYEDNGEHVIQWANEKAIKNFGRIIDKNVFTLIDEDIWNNKIKNKQCDKIKIKIKDKFFELICSHHFVKEKESLLLILRDISKFEYAVIDANKESEATKQELNILQGVIDQQKSIVIVSDGFKIISANKSLYKFFKVKGIEEFISEHKNLSNTFINHKNFFSLENKDKNWIENILKLDVKNRIVSILDLNIFEPKAFTVQVNPLSSDSKHYAVTLTDITEIKLESQQYHFHATHDALTGIYNRSYYFEKIANEIEQSKRYDTTFCIILLDIDHFKKFNDTYGHLKGDEVLIKLSETVQSHVRSADTFARWGGEEFIILLEKTTIDKAELIAEHFRKMVESMKIDGIEKVTASFGVTQFVKGDDDNSILKRADDALYDAKDAGRNRVVIK